MFVFSTALLYINNDYTRYNIWSTWFLGTRIYHIVGKFGGDNVWGKWMDEDFDKKV